MRRVVIHRPFELAIEAGEPTRVGAGEVRIQVAAAGINYADCVVRMGLYGSAKKYVGWPITPGFEVAGTLSEVGSGVSDWRVGDTVMAVTRFGGYATEVVVPASQVFAVPQGFSLVEAAAFPSVHLTAYHAACRLVRLREANTVLVHSAAGGVGSVLVQLAHHVGCKVIGVVGSAHKIGYVRDLGADEVIAARGSALWREVQRITPGGIDVIFDANGVSTLAQSYRHLAPMGQLVIYGFHSMLPRARERLPWLRLARDWLKTPRFSPFRLTEDNRSIHGFNLSYLFEHQAMLRESMDALMQCVRDGVLAPPRVRTFPLASVREALHELERGQTVGKLVLQMDPSGPPPIVDA